MKKDNSGAKKEEWVVVDEKRRAERFQEDNRITITIISKEKKLTKENVIYNLSENISVSGAKIRANVLLSVDTLLKIDFIVHPLYEEITALGQVKWVKTIVDDQWYEAGVEFVNTPSEVIKKLEHYLSWRKKILDINNSD